MFEGMTPIQRRKLHRFAKLAARGARTRRLLRPIIGDAALVHFPAVVAEMDRRRLLKFRPNPKRGKGPAPDEQPPAAGRRNRLFS
jgi:hypothetical protein